MNYDPEAGIAWQEIVEAANRNSMQRAVELKPGLFNHHIGYAPKFGPNASADNRTGDLFGQKIFNLI